MDDKPQDQWPPTPAPELSRPFNRLQALAEERALLGWCELVEFRPVTIGSATQRATQPRAACIVSVTHRQFSGEKLGSGARYGAEEHVERETQECTTACRPPGPSLATSRCKNDRR